MGYGGYTGRIAYVNLTNKLIEYRQKDSREMRIWIGGSGLGTKIFTELCPPDTMPLDPENPLIFMTGPMTGTEIPGSGRHQVIAKSPLTGVFGEADAGGKWGTVLKRAGFDGVILTGQSEKPVYLMLEDTEVSIHEAQWLWGLDNFETDAALKQKYGPDIAVASIGQAGERQVFLATILHEGKKARSSGRGGLGAVMGSKRVKAIVVKGTQTVSIYDKEALQARIKALVPQIEAKTQGLQQYGTAGSLIGAERLGDMPVKNWSLGTWEEAEKISGHTMAEKLVKGKSKCHSCPVACGRMVRTANSRYGAIDGKGPEYETLGMFGGACMITDLEAISKANELCNRYGLDTISTGGTIAFLMDVYEHGLVEKSVLVDGEGNEIKPLWGDSDAVLRLIHAIGRQEGIGLLLGLGVKRAAAQLGQGTEDFAFHVKGLEMPAHDPRAFNSLALGYATSNRGACHLQGGSYFFEKSATLPELGITETLDRFREDNQGLIQARLQDTMCIMDSLKLCKFLFYGGISLTDITNWLNDLTGMDYTVEELLTCGERIFNIKRLYNVSCGISRSDDALPRRITEIPRPDGGAAGNLPPLESMLVEYYDARGWDSEGKPFPATLTRLGLSWLQ